MRHRIRDILIDGHWSQDLKATIKASLGLGWSHISLIYANMSAI